ncbi:MAG: hypothetical protein GX657_04410 [Chloroflexi bacterium]|nr:hypothetical protein [Chloroflexota bacterium]
MSILYCTIPYFAASLARREDPALEERPLVLMGPEGRVLAVSAEAAAWGVAAGLTAREAEVRCPEALLVDADLDRCRQEFEAMVQVLEQASAGVEPHGWGAAYADLDDLARDQSDGQRLCQQIGRAVRQELGEALSPALGWDSAKFTAQAAACRTPPGRVLAVATIRERVFLRPLPVRLLPLAGEALQRLQYLGLRTLGQYAALSPAAVGQQFGRAGALAHRCARGEDDRPVIPRHQAPCYRARCELEPPLADRERLLAALRQSVSPLLAELQARWQACGLVRLTVQFEDGGRQERTQAFFLPLAEEERIMAALGQLLDGMAWRAAAIELEVALEQIQDAGMEQLALFPGERESAQKLQEVERYLSTRFGPTPHLRRAALVQPGAPLPEWRVGWLEEGAR